MWLGKRRARGLIVTARGWRSQASWRLLDSFLDVEKPHVRFRDLAGDTQKDMCKTVSAADACLPLGTSFVLADVDAGYVLVQTVSRSRNKHLEMCPTG